MEIVKDREGSGAKVKLNAGGGEDLGSGDMSPVVKNNIKESKVNHMKKVLENLV